MCFKGLRDRSSCRYRIGPWETGQDRFGSILHFLKKLFEIMRFKENAKFWILVNMKKTIGREKRDYKMR